MTGLPARRKVAFFGSPAFAVPVLQAIMQSHDVVLVVAQPSKPVGRGLKLTPPPVAQYAAEAGLPLAQPRKLRGNSEFMEALRQSGAEVAVTCAYGKLLPAELLAVPRYGFLNTHTSLLPLLRGAAPIQWALIAGHEVTGTTIMQTDVGMDTGDILLQEGLPIDPHWTAIELSEALQAQAARLIVSALDTLDSLTPTPQNHAAATHVGLLDKSDGDIRWTESAQSIYNRYRGVYAWPQSSAYVGGKRVKVLEMQPEPQDVKARVELRGELHWMTPGKVLEVSSAGMLVACTQGYIWLKTVQPEGKKAMPAADWSRGNGLKVGERFDVPDGNG